MRSFRKWTSWILVIALAVALFSGMTLNAEAGETGSSYPEATELLTNVGVMEKEKSWTENLKGAEAKAALNKLGVAPDFADDADVTGAQLIGWCLASIQYGGMNDSAWASFNHLTKGISGFSWTDAVNRETAAQVILNTLKSCPNGSGDMKGTQLGLSYVRTGEDEIRRPYYKWTSGGSDVTGIYLDPPFYVGEAILSWHDVLNLVGVTTDSEWINRWTIFSISWNGNGFDKQRDLLHWGDGHSGCGGDGSDIYNPGAKMEIYADYSWVNANGNEGWNYRILLTNSWLGEVKEENGKKVCYLHGEADGSCWGPWDWDYFQDKDIGFYNVFYSWKGGDTFPIAGFTKAAIQDAKLSEITAPNSQKFFRNPSLRNDTDTDHSYRFYFDPYGNVIGMDCIHANEDKITYTQKNSTNHTATCACGHSEDEAHAFGDWAYADATNHEKVCSKCAQKISEAHVPELRGYEAPTHTTEGYSGDKYCTVCGELLENGHTLEKTACTHSVLKDPVKENEVKASCGVAGRYDLVVYCAECEIKISSTPVDVPALEHNYLTEVIDPTCEEDGYTIHSCEYCHDTYTDNETPALGHDWVEESRVEPTAKEAGKISYVCSHNSNHKRDEEIPVLEDSGASSYPEAIELLTGADMIYPTADWTKALSAEQANKLLASLNVEGGFEKGESISEGAFIAKALEAIGYDVGNDALWSEYNHLTKGIGSYEADRALTMEEAAQIVLNTLKSFKNGVTDSILAEEFGLKLVKTGEDTFRRPSYKWTKGGADLTASYPDTPVAVLQGGTSYHDILNTISVTEDINRWTMFNCAWNGNDFMGNWEKLHWGDESNGCKTDSLGMVGDTLEIYDAYSYVSEPQFGRGYTVSILETWLAEIKTVGGVKKIGVYGVEEDVWGWWDLIAIKDMTEAERKALPEGIYTVNYSWNGKSEGIYGLATASGTAANAVMSENGISAGGSSLTKSNHLLSGVKALQKADGSSAFTLYLDPFGNVLGATEGVVLLEGDNQTWYQNSSKDISVRSSGTFDSFTGVVTMDGTVVDPSNYTAKEGSTVITFKAAYLGTLKLGKHNFTIEHTNGTAKGTLIIKEKSSPKTGGILPGAALLLAMAGTAAVLPRKKEK